MNKLSRQEQVLMATYEATINYSFLCPTIMSILEVFMLIYSIGTKELYGVYLWRYRCLPLQCRKLTRIRQVLPPLPLQEI